VSDGSGRGVRLGGLTLGAGGGLRGLALGGCRVPVDLPADLVAPAEATEQHGFHAMRVDGREEPVLAQAGEAFNTSEFQAASENWNAWLTTNCPTG